MKAKPIPTTTIQDGAGTRSSSPQGEAAAAALAKAHELATRAGSTLPGVLELGCHLADLNLAFEGFEHAKGLPRQPAEPDLSNAYWAIELISDRRDAIQNVIATQPATSVADAAVQVAVIAEFAAMAAGGNERVEIFVSMIERMALSVLPILAQAANLDIDRMAWTYPAGSMRVARFAGVGVTQ